MLRVNVNMFNIIIKIVWHYIFFEKKGGVMTKLMFLYSSMGFFSHIYLYEINSSGNRRGLT